MMLSRAYIASVGSRRLYALSSSRHIGVSAAFCQNASAGPARDPIQKLFIDKIHEYSDKSNLCGIELFSGLGNFNKLMKAGGKLVDASAATEKAMTDELEKLARQYGAKGADFTKFPTFSFTDPELAPVGVNVEVKQAANAAVEEEEEEDDRPYWEAP